MIGKVIKGRYLGSGVYKLPEKNVLFIQTESGEKIALSKRNAVSIEDVSDQYSSNGKKVMMVLWNDFETSIIQFGGTAQPKQQSNRTSEVPKVHKKEEKGSKSKNVGIIILCCITVIVVIIGVILCLKMAGSNNAAMGEQNHNETNTLIEAPTTEVPTTEAPKRTKDDAILEAQTAAIQMASNELKKKLKNPSSLIINDAKFYYPDYDEENMIMNYAAVKLDYNATNSYGGSVRDTYTYFLVDIESLTAEQVVHIGMN